MAAEPKPLVCQSHAASTFLIAFCACVSCNLFVPAVEEAVIALVRLYQNYTFKLSDKQLNGPLEVKQTVTITPKDGVQVTVVPRKY